MLRTALHTRQTRHQTSHQTRRAVGILAATLTVAATTAGCGTGAGAASSAGQGLALDDAWVKAADTGMTAAFGTLVNDADDEVVVVGVATAASPTTELHETVASDGGAMQMQEKDGGFVVPAGGSVVLEPGGDHLMLMDLQGPLRPGETVVLTLQLEGGDELDVDAMVRSFDGADEDYEPGEGS